MRLGEHRLSRAYGTWLGTLAVAATLIGGVAMTRESAGADVVGQAAVVTLDVYSGRPNPTWSLTPEAQRELLQRVAALQLAKAEPPAPPDLGYRAVRAELRDPAGAPVTIAAWHGVVSVVSTGRSERKADPGRALEAWLVETGAATLDPGLVDYVRLEIKTAP